MGPEIFAWMGDCVAILGVVLRVKGREAGWHSVIARRFAPKQSRGGNLKTGLLRFARNDGGGGYSACVKQ
jgi:hypothetical protein